MADHRLTETQRLDLHQQLYRWCWSAQTPEEYLDARGQGLGILAAAHPGAYNLAWAMLGRISASEYAGWLNTGIRSPNMQMADLNWLVSVSDKDFFVQELRGMAPARWRILDQAAKLSYTEFLREFTYARRRAISEFAGYDINDYLDHA